MAEREIILTLKADATDATKGFDQVDEAAKTSVKSIEGMENHLQGLREDISKVSTGGKVFKALREEINNTSLALDEATKPLNTLNLKLSDIEDDLRNMSKEQAPEKLAKNFERMDDVVANNVLSIQELGTAADNYKNIAIAAGAESPIGQEALKKAAALEKQIDKTNKSVDRLNDGGKSLNDALSIGTGVVAGYTAFQGVTALLGEESEELQQTFVKLQAAQSTLMGIKELSIALDKEGVVVSTAQAAANKVLAVTQAAYNAVVGTSTGLMKAFKIALASTGIGLIIVGIGLLIANWETFVGWVSDSVKALEEFAMMLLEMLPFIGGYVKAMREVAEAEAAAAEERRKATKEISAQAAARIKAAEDERDAIISAKNETIKALELEKDTLEAQGKSSAQVTIQILEAEKAKLEAVLNANKEKISSWVAYYEGLAALSGKSTEDFTEEMKLRGIDLKALQDQANDLISENERSVQFAENKITKFKREQEQKRFEAAQERSEKEQALRDKMLADQEAYIQQQLTLEQTLTDLLIENTEDRYTREVAALQEKQSREREALISQFGENSELLKELEKKHESELISLQSTFDQERIKIQEELIDLQLANMEEGADKEVAILKEKHRREREEMREKYGADTELIKELEIRQREELEELRLEQEEIKREQLQAEIDEKIAMAQAALDAMNEINNLIKELEGRRLARIEENMDAQLAALDQQKEQELKREGNTANDKIRIQNEFERQRFQTELKAAKKKDEIAEKQFKREKALKLAEIGINTAASIMQALGGFPPPASFIFAGINATIGTVQAAIVASQKYQSQASQVSPPNFQAVKSTSGVGSGGGSSSGSGGGSSGSGGGSGLQDDTTTIIDDEVVKESKVVVSQVEINDTQNQMADVEEVATV